MTLSLEDVATELRKLASPGVEKVSVRLEIDPICCRLFVLWIEEGEPHLGWIGYDEALKAWDLNMFSVVAERFWEGTRSQPS